MKLVTTFVVLVSALCLVTAQNDGKYRPPTTKTTVRPFPRYRPFDPFNPYRLSSEGRYVARSDNRGAKNDGRYYGGNDGRYVPSNDGRYTHIDGKYQHVNGPSGPGFSNQGPSGSNQGPSGSNRGPSGNNQGPSGSGAGSGSTVNVAPTVASTPLFAPTTSVPVLAKQAQIQVAPRLAQVGDPRDGWKIIRLENRVRGDGYNYVFETENGINAEESGKIESDGQGAEGLRSRGFYEYVGDDGQVYRVDYVADSNGFLPQGDHIPKVPPAIEKLLKYLASQPK